MVPGPGASVSLLPKTGDQRILQIAHNHPRFHSGGTELTALALHHEARRRGLDSWYLGALDNSQILPNGGTNMIALSADSREAALATDRFSRFHLMQQDYFGFLREFRGYLEMIRPDVVHMHHILNFGLEALYVIRSALPDARIVFTLHDFYLICANNGQLYKHDRNERCPGPTLVECLKCFPQHSPNEFAMRASGVTHALSLCDALISPSHFLKSKFDQYLATNQEIMVVENGYLGADVPPATGPEREARAVTFGYFGNISAVKGLGDLLDAADSLLERGAEDFRIAVHGAQLFEDKNLLDRMERAKTTLGKRIRFFGQYKPEDMNSHMEDIDCLVFPSVWWENAPLVIYEALYHRRQVVSYPHGGAPEILARYGAGVIARHSDPASLADAMAIILRDPSLVQTSLTAPIPGRRDLFDNCYRIYAGKQG
ncbi:MAG: hypothetical protein JWM58_2429 [Rhizobium sp.]|nr:hypothetical protein [Rhizobium sp.]